jgi:hypothetical protein
VQIRFLNSAQSVDEDSKLQIVQIHFEIAQVVLMIISSSANSADQDSK